MLEKDEVTEKYENLSVFIHIFLVYFLCLKIKINLNTQDKTLVSLLFDS